MTTRPGGKGISPKKATPALTVTSTPIGNTRRSASGRMQSAARANAARGVVRACSKTSMPPGMLVFEHARTTPLAAFALAALCILPLALRRVFPIGVLVTVSAGVAFFGLMPFPPGLVVIGVLVALY